jgi:ATP-dependent helicase HrpA
VAGGIARSELAFFSTPPFNTGMEFKPPQSRAPRHPRYDAIHRALLTGLISNVGTKSETHEYQGPRSLRFSIFPGSTLFGAKPKWMMAGELVETTKLYARTCAAIQPQWVERVASHLVERTHSDPRWDAVTGSVIATEKVSLYGLVLIPARTVPYGPINPRISRELFIHHALVLGDIRIPPADTPFFRHNSALVAEVELLEAKIRQRNLLADVATRFNFYDARVPQDITNAAQFETWRRRVEAQGGGNPRLLYMNKEDLLRADAPPITPQNYPDRLSDSSGGLRLPVTYRFEPGEAIDGLTLAVPVAALTQLRPERYEWLVPGMLEDKIAALLRELPGAMRRNFVPVPNWAKAAAEAMLASNAPDSDVSLREALASYLAKQTGVEIRAADFSEENLAPHMRMNFKVMDDSGKVIGLSRDLPQLQRKLASAAAGTFATIYDRTFNREHVTAWDFGDMPESLTVQRFKMTIVAYPALVQNGDECALRLLPSKEAADAAHRGGVRRMFRIEYRRDVKSLATHLPHFGQMALQYYTLGKSEELREDLLTLTVDRALFSDTPVPRRQSDYETLKHKAATRLTETADRVTTVASAILQEYHDLTLLMDELGAGLGAAISDVREQLAYLLPHHFLLTTPWEWLEHVPRYLKGMRLRLEKLNAGGEDILTRDYAGMAAVAPWWNGYLERKEQHAARGIVDPEMALFRWMLEEYRVSLFAQELGTATPISERRLEKQWEKVRRVM